MSQNLAPWSAFRAAVGIALAGIVFVVTFSWLYTTIQLRSARAAGIYSSAEDGMRTLIARSYVAPRAMQIAYAGTNSFDGSEPHVWYVIACVWGGTRADGSPVGSSKHAYDQPGSYFLAAKDGWVHVPEGALPEFIGYWMKVFDLAGAGLFAALARLGRFAGQ